MTEPATGKTMTIRDVARALGCNPETVKGHVRQLWPCLMRSGKTTYLTEAQVTVILEKMKGSGASMAHIGDQQQSKASLQSNFAGIETRQSMTIREVAEVLGVAHDKITRKVRELFPELMQNGITTYLNEAQVTAVKLAITSQLAAMVPTQNCVGQENEMTTKVVSAKTRLEKALIIQQAMRLQGELIQELKAENNRLAAAYGREVLDHKATKNLLGERETGLESIQRIAESGGLVLSDRDDLLSAYGGRV
jgi:DNA-binding Lrp family transcriptional regulator